MKHNDRFFMHLLLWRLDLYDLRIAFREWRMRRHCYLYLHGAVDNDGRLACFDLWEKNRKIRDNLLKERAYILEFIRNYDFSLS